MNRKITEQLRQERLAAERDNDTIHYLHFTPTDGREIVHDTSFSDPWCMRMVGNPKGNPQILPNGILAFEAQHNVKSWREVAVKYDVREFHYP